MSKDYLCNEVESHQIIRSDHSAQRLIIDTMKMHICPKLKVSQKCFFVQETKYYTAEVNRKMGFLSKDFRFLDIFYLGF